ncbi:SusC/RagA family TonB-linked outer membrane protein [Chryseobacterium sp.]|uniref:SusC/RagA family TonB-linked outer membrane protein n=1 Tax=Chryseobacterium sp. TaxID=1871047 RepID=UPI002FCC9979
MNVKLKVLSVGVIFFIANSLQAQRKRDTLSSEQKIEEVVILGYSKTTTKAKATVASTTVSAENFENRPNISFLSSLQGAAPGVQINQSSGSPGSGRTTVLIRGLSSLSASSDPLYIIDGLATSGSEFRNLNANDIESASVLRDAAATSVYGSRAAGGVIIITTKSGRYKSPLKFSYDAQTSFSSYPDSKYNPANAKQFLQVQKNFGAGGLGTTLTQDQINNYAIDTDWNREFFRVGVTQQHNVGITVGGENSRFFSSLGYLNSEGAIKSTDFQRFTFRNNLNGKSKDGKFEYGVNLGLGYSKRNQLDEEENSANISSNSLQNVLFGGILSDPSMKPYYFSNGQDMYNQLGGNSAAFRPYVLYDNVKGGVRNRYTQTSVTSNINGKYKLTPWLSVGNRTGLEFKENDRIFARDPRGYLSVVVAANAGIQFGGSETQSNIKDFTFNSVTDLTFNKAFGKHSVTASVFFDYLKAHYMSKSFTQNGLNPLNWSFGAGTGYIPFNQATPTIYNPSVGALKINAGTLAYVATLDYDYDGKYGVTGTLRRDGSYRFSPENRWDNFYAVAARWNIDQEDFMTDSNFKLLKLRVSRGTQGNQNVGQAANNTNLLFLNPTLALTIDASNTGYQNLPGYTLSALGNSGHRWEQITQTNVGLDYNYKNIIEGTVDLYEKSTSDMYTNINLSGTTGQQTLLGNFGKMKNRGVEALIKANIFNKPDYKLSVYVNGSYNRNKIIDMSNQDLSGDNVNAIGQVAAQWNLYHYVGVNSATGEQQFLDVNGNITEAPTSNDRKLTGKSIYAPYTGGFGLNANYSGFFADVMFTFQAGAWSYDNLYSWMMNPNYAANGLNVSSDLLNSWTPTNTNTDIPNLKAVNIGSSGSSDRFLYKTDFIRLKNVSVGYAFTKQQLQNLPIKGLKIFAQAENLYTWTNWKGFDPEPVRTYSLGIYPNSKTISVGANVEF